MSEESNTSITTTPVYLASLCEDTGCGGVDSVGYVYYDSVRTRTEIEADWDGVERAQREAKESVRASWPEVKAPLFDGSWQGTRREHKTAVAEAEERTSVRNTAIYNQGLATEASEWSKRGARRFELTAGWLPSVGGEYDDEATAVEGAGLRVMRYLGCRCGHGGGSYHDDAEDDDKTPRVWLVRVVADDETREFISLTSDVAKISEAFETRRNMARSHAEFVRDQRDRLCRYEATTSDELDSMTYAEYEAWKASTKLTGGPAGVVRLGGELRRFSSETWDTHWEREGRHLVSKAGADAGLFEIGLRIKKGLY